MKIKVAYARLREMINVGKHNRHELVGIVRAGDGNVRALWTEGPFLFLELKEGLSAGARVVPLGNVIDMDLDQGQTVEAPRPAPPVLTPTTATQSDDEIDAEDGEEGDEVVTDLPGEARRKRGRPRNA